MPNVKKSFREIEGGVIVDNSTNRRVLRVAVNDLRIDESKAVMRVVLAALERGYGSRWDRIRLQALKRDHYLCQPCQTKGRVTPAKEVDHITPKARGGTDDLTNLQSICTPCHRDKTAAEAAEAQGRTYRPRVEIGLDGWPVEGCPRGGWGKVKKASISGPRWELASFANTVFCIERFS